MKKTILALALLALAVALSGCVQQEEYKLTQEQANYGSDKFIETYDGLVSEENAKMVEECQFIDGFWCRAEDKQVWESDCRKDPFPEECLKLSKVWPKEGLDMAIRLLEERDKRRPLAVNLKQTRNMLDVLEIGSSFRKLVSIMQAFQIGIVNSSDYEAFVTEGVPFNGMNNESEIENYLIGIRKEFDEKKNVNITGEKSWDIIYTPSPDGNVTIELRNFFSDAWINSLPSEKKEEAYGRTRMGFDEFLEICKTQANKFDAAEAKADKYQMAFSAGYLSYCNIFLDQFSN